MKRRPEPELMDSPAQVAAYAAADFAEAHDRFVALFRARFPDFDSGRVLDLGCGPGDITRRFATAYPRAAIVAVDGGPNMLAEAARRNRTHPAGGRITLRRCLLPRDPLPPGPWAALISNSLLHHLHDPQVLWRAVTEAAGPGTRVCIMDLRRPPDDEAVAQLVAQYAADAPPVLRADFRASLRAAFEPAEVEAQLAAAGLDWLGVEVVSDRHLLVSGRR